MTKLSDIQALILSAAAQHLDLIALPLPDSLHGGAAAKVVSALMAKCFLQEVEADLRKGEPLWRETGDGYGGKLVATDARPRCHRDRTRGRQHSACRRDGGADRETRSDTATGTVAAPKAHTPREGTK